VDTITAWVQRPWFYWMVKWGFFIFAKLFLGLSIEGRWRVPPKERGGLVVVSNHISTLDPPVMGASMPREVHYMAKKELFENRYFRAIPLGLRSFPVDREGNASGAIKEAIRRLKQNLAIGIFIQGTRNAGDAEALDGAAFIAQRAGVALQPAAIWREGRRYRVRFGEPIMPQGKSREEAARLTDLLMVEINALLPEHAKMKVVAQRETAATPQP
jgi:1-acyl-sn-glycerol-3-phosphate acyltransferase